MNADVFEMEIERILEDEKTTYVHSSPDFQCDVTDGFPVSLFVAWGANRAWLQPNATLPFSEKEKAKALRQCADFGFRRCESIDNYNSILQELGRDAVESAWLIEEDEGGIELT